MRVPTAVEMFQFHTGSIKSSRASDVSFPICPTCFNSILVRLKVTINFNLAFTDRGFNSILVRLKDVTLTTLPASYKVSIPYWFD